MSLNFSLSVPGFGQADTGIHFEGARKEIQHAKLPMNFIESSLL